MILYGSLAYFHNVIYLYAQLPLIHMLMKNKIFLFPSACILLITFFVSCHTGKHAATQKPVTRKSIVADTKSIRKKYADILGVKPKNIENTSLYSFIEKWY